MKSLAPSLRRRALLAAAGALPLLPVVSRAQTTFPNGPLTFIVPWPAGSTSDGLMRVLARSAGQYLGQTIVVHNKPGAGSLVGAQTLSAARPDGYTVGQVTQSIVRFQQLGQTDLDPRKDLTPIARVAGFTFGIVVRADSPYRTMRELIDYAKANPGKLSYGSSGVAGQMHIGMELISREAGISLLHVPYKGGNEAVQSLMAGEVDMVADSSGWLPLVEEGRLRLINVWGAERLARFPEVPTLRDLGYNLQMSSPFGIAGPAGIPEGPRAKLAAAFEHATLSAEFKAALDRLLMPTMYLGPAEYTAFIAQSYDEETRLIDTLKLRELLKK